MRWQWVGGNIGRVRLEFGWDLLGMGAIASTDISDFML